MLARFKQAVKQVITSKRLVLAVVHSRARDELISQMKEREDTAVFTVTLSNRDNLLEVLKAKIFEISTFSPKLSQERDNITFPLMAMTV